MTAEKILEKYHKEVGYNELDTEDILNAMEQYKSQVLTEERKRTIKMLKKEGSFCTEHERRMIDKLIRKMQSKLNQ